MDKSQGDLENVTLTSLQANLGRLKVVDGQNSDNGNAEYVPQAQENVEAINVGGRAKKRRRNRKRKKKTQSNGNGSGIVQIDDTVEVQPVLQNTTGSGTENKGTNSKKTKPKSKSAVKIVTSYKCIQETCGKTWNSVHGWTKMYNLFCEFCDCKAAVQRKEEGMIMVELFQCPAPNCGNTWPYIHDETNLGPIIQDCDCCWLPVTSSGAQLRFGRQYWIRCLNKDCAEEWEEVSTEADYSQRCSKCFNRGTKVGKGPAPLKGRNQSGYAGGSHDIAGCDMCQILQKQGVANSCMSKKRVDFEGVTDQDGVQVDRVVTKV